MSVHASQFGTCSITIDNKTGAVLVFDNESSTIVGDLSDDAPAKVPAHGTGLYKIIPGSGKATSSATLNFLIHGIDPYALIVTGSSQPPVNMLSVDTDQAAIAATAKANGDSDYLIGTVTVAQATTEVLTPTAA